MKIFATRSFVKCRTAIFKYNVKIVEAKFFGETVPKLENLGKLEDNVHCPLPDRVYAQPVVCSRDR